MTRRAFTLMEVILATSLGALLVLMIIAMFGFMDRSEGAQVRRIEQIESLSRIHKVMERVFSAVVVADQNAPTPPPTARAVASTDSKRQQRMREPTRMSLAPDQSSALNAAMRRFKTGSGAVQRLEVVLDRLPVPRNFARGLTGDVGTSLQANQETDQDQVSGPIRGVFELRPDAATIRVDGKQAPERAEGRTGWTLWWRALPFDPDGPDPAQIDPTEDPNAVPIASGLAACNWKAFVKRERQDTISVTSYLDMPAYMEMEVTTLGGFYASWMFEMQWTIQREDASDAERILRDVAEGRLKADQAAAAAPKTPDAQKGAAVDTKMDVRKAQVISPDGTTRVIR